MSRDYRLYLDDIRECCEKILRYTHGLTFRQMEEYMIVGLAILRVR